MKIIENKDKKIRAEIEKINDHSFYSMNYYGNDGYDEYLLKGAANIDEFCTFINCVV